MLCEPPWGATQYTSSDMKRILILEDDCHFSKDVHAVSACVEDGLKQLDWALFYCGALNEVSAKSARPGLHEVAPTEGLLGSDCVAVKGGSIEKIAEYFEGMLHRHSVRLMGCLCL